MTNVLVERAYTYVGKDTPTLFYYHQTCWAKATPDTQPPPTEEVVAVARGTVRLVSQAETPFGIRCKQCEKTLHPEPNAIESN